MEVTDIVSAKALGIASLALGLYTVYGLVWRLYWSPISAFPGPKLAAATFWYEFYYDIFPKYGQYTFHIRDLHKKYGPIIRINPYELHVSTPQFYETVYSSNKRRDKWYWFTKMLGIDGSGFATPDHYIHRERRAALNPFFSPSSVRRLQPVVDERVQACIGRLRGLRGTGEVVRCVVVASAFANDVVMKYAFGKTYGRLEAPDFDIAGYESGHQTTSLGFLMKHMYWILWTIQRLPDALVKRMNKSLAMFLEIKDEFRNQVIEIMTEKNVSYKDLSHPTLFHELLQSNLPPEEKGVQRLTDEAQTVVVAGSETVAFALTVATYHLLSHPSILQKLKSELAEAIPNPNTTTPQSSLEQLPYLTGVVKEALRLSYGVSTRSQRISYEPLAFQDWTIPAGTPVGMTSVIIHHDQSIFPESREFRPERWVEDARLDRYLVAFSKGSRQCLGMHLGTAEMYLWLAGVYRRFGSKEVRFEGDEGVLELVGTGLEDVEIAADRFVPNIKSGSQGVRIRVLP